MICDINHAATFEHNLPEPFGPICHANIDAFVKSQNLSPRRKDRKGNLLILNTIFLARLASGP
jgi:hypothetical protein